MFETVRDNPLPTTKKFPYILNTGRGSAGQWHTQTRTREIPDVSRNVSKEAYICINTKLAEENDVKENEMLRVYSINGNFSDFKAKITDNVKYD